MRESVKEIQNELGLTAADPQRGCRIISLSSISEPIVEPGSRSRSARFDRLDWHGSIGTVWLARLRNGLTAVTESRSIKA